MGTSGPDDPQRRAFRDKLAELERAFRAKLVVRATELEEALARATQGDEAAAQQVAAIVHKLSGSAGSFGAVELSETATTLDLALHAGTAPAALVDELRALIEAMRATAAAGD